MFADYWKDAQNILCIRLDNMGDVLMTEPAMRALKEAKPGRKVTLLTSSAGAPIAPMLPVVDEVLTFDVPWVKTDDAAGERRLLELADTLREKQFDAAVIFTVYSQNPLPTAMLCYLAGIKTVLGYCRENPYRLISQWVPDNEPFAYVVHEVERQLDLVAKTGAMPDDTHILMKVADEDSKAAAQKLTELDLAPDGKWFVLHAGVSEDKRRYPATSYVGACRQLIKQGYTVVLTGSKGEREYVEDIARELGERARNIAGELSVGELAGLIAEAPLLVSNNTGPVHIAAAVGTPVVVLYAMTNPQHTPWQVANRVLYFEVPEELRSKNRLLQTFPGRSEPKASPEAIVRAVNELAGQ